MNDNIKTEEKPEPVYAGRIIRLIASISDFFILLLFIFIIYSPSKREYFPSFAFTVGLTIILETFFTHTPAKFLLRLEVVYEKKSFVRRLLRSVFKHFLSLFSYLTILDHPRRQGWHDRIGRSRVYQLPLKRRFFKGLGLMVLSIYAWMLFGVSHAIESNLDQKDPFELAYIMPEKINDIPEKKNVTYVKVFSMNTEILLPQRVGGLNLGSNSFLSLYSKEMEPNKKNPEILILPLSIVHPAVNKTVRDSPLWEGENSPKNAQEFLFYLHPRKRWLQWNPFIRIHFGFLIGVKAFQFRFLENPSFLYHYSKGDLSIFWTAQTTDIRNDFYEGDPYKMDILFFADSKSFTTYFIKWTGIERKEELIHSIMNSIRFRERGQVDMEEIREQALKRRSLIHAWELLRLNDFDIEYAELLYELLQEKGLAWEKHYFSLLVQKQAGEDYRYHELRFLTRQWVIETAVTPAIPSINGLDRFE